LNARITNFSDLYQTMNAITKRAAATPKMREERRRHTVVSSNLNALRFFTLSDSSEHLCSTCKNVRISCNPAIFSATWSSLVALPKL
jgi:molybdenum cofactor biosynthesis enzyme MoaA